LPTVRTVFFSLGPSQYRVGPDLPTSIAVDATHAASPTKVNRPISLQFFTPLQTCSLARYLDLEFSVGFGPIPPPVVVFNFDLNATSAVKAENVANVAVASFVH